MATEQHLLTNEYQPKLNEMREEKTDTTVMCKSVVIIFVHNDERDNKTLTQMS